MSLRRIERRRCPHDKFFRTTARLNSILRAMANYNDDKIDLAKPIWDVINETTVPIWVRMEKYKAQETKRNPDGMIWGPVIRIGTMTSPEIPLFGYHHAAGLFYDYTLDGIDASDDGRWLYYPIEGDGSWGEDVSVYECSKCGKHNYRDDFGIRHDLSACLMDGELVCRACDWHGMIATSEVQQRMGLCRLLASHVGGNAPRSLERAFEMFERKVSGCGNALQTRLWLDGEWSFTWSTLWFDKEASEWKRYMHGGLIMHGPQPAKTDNNDWSFSTWDYGKSCVRAATPAEVANIEWSVHT